MATAPESPRIFMDPVHGSIELEPYLVAIIDTPEFQRLRKIKQLGGACYVYPGATHTRFEHSIGVCHIAGHLVKELKKHSPEYEITEEEEVCIKIAALCHDIGHGPYSHLYDFAVKDSQKPSDDMARHEYRSAVIVQEVIKQLVEPRQSKYKELEIAHKRIELIQAMIKFSEEYEKLEKKKVPNLNWTDISAGEPETKSYLFEIVANGFTGIDVDKMDYFARDSRSVGLPNSFDWRRFTQTARIIETDDGYCHICSRDKDAPGLYELFHTRTVLYRTVYRHKTVVIIEHMIQEALIAANSKISIKGKPLLECWNVNDMDAFHYLTDSFIEEIIMTGAGIKNEILTVDSDMSEPQKWLERVRNRKLPKFLTQSSSCELELECEHTIKVTEEMHDLFEQKHTQIEQSARKHKRNLREKTPEEIQDGYIIRKKAKFSYGKEDQNPIESHNFYRKWDSKCPYKLEKEEVSAILPTQFEEIKFFWYYDKHKHKKVKCATSRKSLLKSLRDFKYSKKPIKPSRKPGKSKTCTCYDDQ